MAGRKSDFTLPKFDDIFSTQEMRDDEKLAKIRDIPLELIDDFPDHPYKVRDDEDMMQLVESIKERGVITPATVRQKEDGRYELISGHRRKRAKAIFRRVIVGAIVLSAASLLFMFFAGQYVAPLFVKPEDTELLAVSIVGMKLFSLSYLTGWVDMCFSSYFTALERPVRSMLTSFFGTLIFPIVALFVLAPWLGLNGVWLSSLASTAISAVFTIILFITLQVEKSPKNVLY